MEKIAYTQMTFNDLLVLLRKQENRFECDFELQKSVIIDRIKKNDEIIEMQNSLEEEIHERKETEAQVAAERKEGEF